MSPSPSSLSERVDRLLARYRPLADRTGFAFRRPRVSSAAHTVPFAASKATASRSYAPAS